MYLVITKDAMMFDSIAHIVGPDNAIHILNAEDICLCEHRQSYVIIDMLRNNIFYTDIICRLNEIAPRHIYIMSPFGIKHCLPSAAVRFIPRTISVKAFRDTILCGHSENWCPDIYFTQKQYQVISRILQRKTDRHIAQEMGISLKTLSVHKYNIMLLLNIKKCCHLLTHRFAVYFCNETIGYISLLSENNEYKQNVSEAKRDPTK